MVALGYHISETFEVPVMIRPTTRVCHSRQVSSSRDSEPCAPPGFFEGPQRWAATPKYRYHLHHQLNRKIETVTEKFRKETISRVLGNGKTSAALFPPGSLSATPMISSGK